MTILNQWPYFVLGGLSALLVLVLTYIACMIHKEFFASKRIRIEDENDPYFKIDDSFMAAHIQAKQILLQKVQDAITEDLRREPDNLGAIHITGEDFWQGLSQVLQKPEKIFPKIRQYRKEQMSREKLAREIGFK